MEDVEDLETVETNTDTTMDDVEEEDPAYKSYTRTRASPPRRNPQEVISATPFAGVYRSIWTLNTPGRHILPLISHVNCSYLSTPGVAPTLLQLKQHAQSLTILIKSITASTSPAVIDNENAGIEGIPSFHDGETYDFLNNLTKRYTGPKTPAYRAHHNMPLTALLNVLEEVEEEAHSHTTGDCLPHIKTRTICPLYSAPKTPDNQPGLPYKVNQSLLEHANEALELLDHEYSAKGGLLAILPTQDRKEERAKAETTLLGQMILYIQRLVQRVHDLERLYANAMDVLAGEALVPHQALSQLGPDGRRGREMVYPQDRFVLVNAGNDVYSFLNSEFDKKERADEAVMQNYKRLGVTGEVRLWKRRYEEARILLDDPNGDESKKALFDKINEAARQTEEYNAAKEQIRKDKEHAEADRAMARDVREEAQSRTKELFEERDNEWTQHREEMEKEGERLQRWNEDLGKTETEIAEKMIRVFQMQFSEIGIVKKYLHEKGVEIGWESASEEVQAIGRKWGEDFVKTKEALTRGKQGSEETTVQPQGGRGGVRKGLRRQH